MTFWAGFVLGGLFLVMCRAVGAMLAEGRRRQQRWERHVREITR